MQENAWESLTSLRKLKSLDFVIWCEKEEPVAKAVATLTNLRSLIMDNCNYSQKTIWSYCSTLTLLKELCVPLYWACRYKQLDFLTSFTNLTRFYSRKLLIRPDTLLHLSSALQSLTHLTLIGLPGHVQSVRYLSSLTRLKELNLESPRRIDPESHLSTLSHLSVLRNLEYLNVNRWRADHYAGLDFVSGCSSLKELDMNLYGEFDIDLSLENLGFLRKMKCLEVLMVGRHGPELDGFFSSLKGVKVKKF
eukprot:TRINITY_DN12718_c0_g1_i1.p1 TRINITY_DN12718_c0_g1~~TRINITY_DN12718_c0_g1_i1.p1  ORF type:complete len:279 (+),score=32.23 TRINITY_DN12718_c0_g1_i1:90-839(+)